MVEDEQLYMLRNLLPILLPCHCLVTHAVKQLLIQNCLALPRTEGAETLHVSTLINNLPATVEVIFRACPWKFRHLNSV